MATLKNTTISDTGFLKIATGTNAQRPGSPVLGDFRYNTEEEVFELYNGAEWVGAGGGGAGLYDFTSATFTPGGAVHKNGPSLTQARNGITGGDSFKNDTQFFNEEGNGVLLWTVPTDGTYRIECWGGQGGGPCTRQGTAGGQGARMRGDFTLTESTVLRLVVGQIGWRQNNGWGGGTGGGGTFVWQDGSSTPLIIAGGGGGSGQSSNGQQGGRTGTSGGQGSNGGPAGGTNGGTAGGNCGGGSGSAWNGGSTSSCGGSFTWQPIRQNANSPTGYSSGGHDANGGGWGGGAGSYGGSGGGGGYSGGGPGGWSYAGFGGGGGSYNGGSNQSNSAGVQSGGGQITITLL